MTATAERPAPLAAYPAPRSIIDPYDPRADAETFDLTGWLATIDTRLFDTTAGRKALTYADPLLFACLYLRKHLESEETGGITLADCHLDWFRLGREWMIQDVGLRGWRHSFASPRASGKSTMWYTIIPVWAAAHGHIKFIATFANGSTQAEMHLQTFRTEAAHNQLLRMDYPEMCTAIRKPTGRTVADNEGMYQSRSGFVWVARGIDVGSLGMKVSDRRPDAIVLDDIEKDESRYSPGEVQKRLNTMIDAIFPLNERAKVVIVGTVTRPASINHQLVKIATGEVDYDTEEGKTLQWIRDERIVPHYYPPIVTRPSGSRRSIWPEKWSLDYLESIEHTRNYQKNFRNNPRADSGDLWTEDDIRYAMPPNVTRTYLFVDPPVTQKTTSDPAGLAVLGWAPGTGRLPAATVGTGGGLTDALTAEELAGGRPARLPRVVVLHAEEFRATGTPLKKRILKLLEQYPAIGTVVIEVNQGGDLWDEVMTGLPVKLVTFTSGVKKEIRFAWALDLYQKRRVTHARPLLVLEDQMTSFPRVEHDDVVDAAATGTVRLLLPDKARGGKQVRPHKDRTIVPR
jgi:hypothetical protein